MTETLFPYSGRELPLFAAAVNWRGYWQAHVSKFIRGKVLEVGAGVGSVSFSLYTPQVSHWLALEPDAALCAEFVQRREQYQNRSYESRQEYLADISDDSTFDVVLYIDVLEHIQDDCAELRLAARHLAPGGRLVVLSPAHQFLYTAFDQAVGHVRRYKQRKLLEAAPTELRLLFCRYLDAAGLLLSLGNRLLLHSAQPTAGQIHIWDKYVIPMSRIIDPLFMYRLGKSLLAVWENIDA